MEKLCYFIMLLMVLLSCQIHAQHNDKIITDVAFSENDIILNQQKAYDYTIDKNSFLITNMKGKPIIKGTIKKDDQGKWYNTIEFLTVKKQFLSKKIIGRNALVFALANGNIIKKNFKFNRKKLLLFIAQHNEGLVATN